jgi:thymidylate synthase ThyX
MAGKFSKLNHTSSKLPNGGEVIVLDKGAVIGAESEAMLQALYSRSPGSIRHHLEILDEKGSDDFMEIFYVGYNHKSIGDCGTGTAFVEGVSMLAAKAIQDFALYSGQETSTRYVDFSNQPMIDPTNSKEGRELLEMQRAFYLSAIPPTVALLTRKYPRNEGEKEKTYEKAIKARAFDITRGLLPAGAATNAAWHTNLRQAADRILFLRHHPLEEVRHVAHGLEEALSAQYPHSFGHKRYLATERYQDVIAANYFFYDPKSPLEPIVDFKNIDRLQLELAQELFEERPAKTELPKYLSQIGQVKVDYQLDFGSFRDIQRHRAITQRMPLLTMDLGFNEWYVQNLPEDVKKALPVHLESIREGIGKLGVSRRNAQYFIPMGYNTSNRFSGDLPGTVYMVELRDSSLVHPTLQRVAHSIGDQIVDSLGIPLHRDNDPGRFNVKRGDQDISLK